MGDLRPVSTRVNSGLKSIQFVRSALGHFKLIMETGERCRNHAGFHAELLTFAHELGVKIF